MKAIHAIAAVSLLASSLASAQEQPPVIPAAAEEKPSSLSLEPAANQPKLEVPPGDEIGLIPEAPAPVQKPKGSAIPHDPTDTRKIQRAKPTEAEDELASRIRMRQLKTKVSRDPKIVDLLAQAENAKTDLEKREALKAYYTLFYAKIEKMDKSLKKRATEQRNRAVHRLEQTRIDPTIPIDTRDREEPSKKGDE